MPTRFTDHTGTGTAAARPAAGTVPQGYLYFASDTGQVSKSDGVSTWTTVLTSTGSAVTDATIATSDITTNNVSISKHGWAPKAPNDATKYLDGTGAYSVPAAAAVAAAARSCRRRSRPTPRSASPRSRPS